MKLGVVSADRTEENSFPRNIGDAALTSCLAYALRRQEGVEQVVVADAGRPRSAGRTFTGTPSALLGFVKDVDAVVLGGGTMLADDQPDSWAGLPRLCASTALACKLLRRPLVILAVGAEKPGRSYSRNLLKFTVKSASYVSARESASARLLQESFGVSASIGADAIWLKDPPDLNMKRQGLVLALNRREVARLNPDAMSSLREEFGQLKLLSMDQSEEWDFNSLGESVADNVDVIPPTNSVEDVMRIISSSEGLVASRMHALYFGLQSGTPAIAIASSPKVQAFCDEFGVHALPPESMTTIQATMLQLGSPERVQQARQRVTESVVTAVNTLRSEVR